MRRMSGWLVVFTIGVWASTAQADVFAVPNQVPTIQEAIDLASDGDKVVVSPGIYNETIDFLGKAITVESHFGPAVTIIHGGGAGSVVTFENGEDEDSILHGFTIRAGSGSAGGGHANVGGGIKIIDAWPQIHCCTVENNIAVRGGGLFVGGGTTDALQAPWITSCVFQLNQAAFGGGICVDEASINLSHCTIRDNEATLDGGGCWADPDADSEFDLRNSVVRANEAGRDGGGLFALCDEVGTGLLVGWSSVVDNVAGGTGGGLHVESTAAVGAAPEGRRLKTTSFIGNRASSGGGWSIDATSPGPLVIIDVNGCVFAQNLADGVGPGAGLGGGIHAELENTRLRIEESVVADNVAWTSGDAMHADGRSHSGSYFIRSILWNNGPAPLTGDLPPLFSYAFSVVGDYVPPNSNEVIDVDPEFWDPSVGDYWVPVTSPATAIGAYLDKDEPWSPVIAGIPGENGFLSLSGDGPLTPGSTAQVGVGHSGDAVSILFVGLTALMHPLEGATLVPSPDVLMVFAPGVPAAFVTGTIPSNTPVGLEFYLQRWSEDACATRGFVATHGLKGTVQ